MWQWFDGWSYCVDLYDLLNYIISKQLYVLSIQTVDALTQVYFEITFLWAHNMFPLMILYFYTKKFHCIIHTYQCTIPAGRAGRLRFDASPRQSASDWSRIGSNALRHVCMVMKNQMVIKLHWLHISGLFTKEVYPWLAKRPLVFNGRVANRGLTSLKEATGVSSWWWYLHQWQTSYSRYLHTNYICWRLRVVMVLTLSSLVAS